MILLEYEAKQLLHTDSFPLPKSEFIQLTNSTPVMPALNPPFVLKSQVPTGGRGKLGGIKIINSLDEYETTMHLVATTSINGFLPTHLLIEDKISIASELYLSIRLDRESQSLQLLAHPDGGIEIEDHTLNSFFIRDLRGAPSVELSNDLHQFYGLPSSVTLQSILDSLYRCAITNDATLIEINPLILTTDNKLIAGDCKMILDDAAVFRHQDWDFYDETTETNFVEVDPSGKIATIANGAGLAMATLDAAHEEGLEPINFLDIGGGANESTILNTFKKLSEYHDVQGIIINIFAGITRCDEVARAIIAASNKINHLPKLYIRLSGTNYQQAKELLDAAHITLYPDLSSCLKAAKKDIS